MLRYLFLFAVTAVTLSAGTFTVTTAGPLTSTSITTSILNDDGFDLLSVTFGMAGTTAIPGGQLVIDNAGHFGESGPPGGTFAYFQANPVGGGFSTFGYTFTGFNNLESFSFSWDPDRPADASYGAIVSETAGMTVTLLTSGGTVSGTMQIVGQNVVAVINSPIPEPTSMLLMGLGLIGLASRRLLKNR
ncbi:MAG: PEP-CTERM sorting domain-containing protein [Bryobacteraceae bacterium]